MLIRQESDDHVLKRKSAALLITILQNQFKEKSSAERARWPFGMTEPGSVVLIRANLPCSACGNS